LCLSCFIKCTKRVNENELKTYLESRYTNADSTVKMIDFKYLKMDTLTQASLCLMYCNNLISDAQENSKLLELELEDVKHYADMYALSISADMSSANYFKHKAEEADQQFKKIDAENVTMINTADSLNKNIKSLDSLTALYYVPVCYVKLKLKNGSTFSDTSRAILDLDMNIVDSDFFQEMLKKRYQQ
jgi:hypothetical protein